MSEMLRRAVALKRHGALTRPTFGKPRGTRERAADRKEPVPGHYYPGTPAWFTVLDEPLLLDVYVETMRLTDINEEMRVAAIHVVEEYGDASHVPALSAVLHEGPCEHARRQAAHALASVGGPPAEESLWRALENEVFPTRVREAALIALLDLLTPDGWDNYTFMNLTNVSLSADVYDRLARVSGLSYDVAHNGKASAPNWEEVLSLLDEIPADSLELKRAVNRLTQRYHRVRPCPQITV